MSNLLLCLMESEEKHANERRKVEPISLIINIVFIILLILAASKG